MKQKIISALFLSGTILVPNFALADSKPESTKEIVTITESEAAAIENSEPAKWEKVLEKLPKLSGYLKQVGTTTLSVMVRHHSKQNVSV